jgi:hypothetical protein
MIGLCIVVFLLAYLYKASWTRPILLGSGDALACDCVCNSCVARRTLTSRGSNKERCTEVCNMEVALKRLGQGAQTVLPGALSAQAATRIEKRLLNMCKWSRLRGGETSSRPNTTQG